MKTKKKKKKKLDKKEYLAIRDVKIAIKNYEESLEKVLQQKWLSAYHKAIRDYRMK